MRPRHASEKSLPQRSTDFAKAFFDRTGSTRALTLARASSTLQRTTRWGWSSVSASLPSSGEEHRSATVPASDFSTRPNHTFADAVAAFARGHAAGARETWTADLIADLERLSAFFAGDQANAGFSALWRLSQPPRISMMRQRSIDLLPYDRMRAWKQGLGEADGRRGAEEAAEHFEKVRTAYRMLIGCIAQSLAHELAAHLTGVIEAYDRRKRDAAVLDFDDLLRQARALVCEAADQAHEHHDAGRRATSVARSRRRSRIVRQA
ncbi:hypothetical protein ABIA99_005934 [Bradyrhizobium sp. LB12.1]